MPGHCKCRVAAVPHHVSVVGVEEANQTSEAFLNHASYLVQGKRQLKTNLDDINHTADVHGHKYHMFMGINITWIIFRRATFQTDYNRLRHKTK